MDSWDQGGGAYRLGHVVIKARPLRAVAVLVLPVAGDGDQDRPGRSFLLAQLPF